MIPRLHGGGVERGTIEIATYLHERGHETTVISEGGPLVEQLECIGVAHLHKAVGSKTLRVFLGFWQLRKYIREERPDIIHSRSRLPSWLCFFAIKSLPRDIRPKFVTSVHGLHSVSRYSSIITKGDRIEVVSTAAERYLRENYRTVDMSRVKVIQRGIDPEIFNHQFEPDSAWKEDWNKWCVQRQVKGASIVAIVGRISRLKGHHDFLNVIESLFDQDISVKGLIIGSASKDHIDLYKELKHRVEQSNVLRQSVFFLGHRKDVRELMKSSSIVVSFSSTPESFGRTVLEALSLGVPVVGYDHGGVGALLRSLFPLGAVPVGDTYEASVRIRNLLDQKHAVASHSLTLSAMCEKTLAMYEELV